MSKKYQDSSSMIWWVIGIMVLTGVLLAGFIYLNSVRSGYNKRVVSNKTNRELALICTTDMATEFHIHPNLEIVINGQKQKLPESIGRGPICMNSIHTHDDSGVIHVESPEKRDFTLSDFFAVWEKTYSKYQILDYKIDASHIIRQTINGKDSQDYENTILRDNDQIIIYYEEKN